ncbi:MAG: hypothetical protein UHM85_10390 [Acutalibacteraceae bacterium]|nr:hypothetical protein [Acutalibacteraceae bacterium]
MTERNEKRILNIIFAVLAVVIIIFAVDIELKLSKLMSSEPVVVNTYPETSESTTVDIYSFHNELTADNTTSAPAFNVTAQADAETSESTTVKTDDTTVLYTYATTVYSTSPFDQPSDSTTVPVTEPSITAVPSTIWSVDADQNFYRTKSGNKYHKADCSYLKNSRILVTIDEIISEGYEPCSKCMKGE